MVVSNPHKSFLNIRYRSKNVSTLMFNLKFMNNVIMEKMEVLNMSKILIVDDEAFMRLLMCNALNNAGYETCEASKGFQAVERYKVEKPDMIFLGFSLSDIDGIEVLKQI